MENFRASNGAYRRPSERRSQIVLSISVREEAFEELKVRETAEQTENKWETAK